MISICLTILFTRSPTWIDGYKTLISFSLKYGHATYNNFQDIEKFSHSFIHLCSDIAKPIIDIFLFAIKLSESIGPEAPILILSYFLTSSIVLKSISPPFAKYISKEQKLEGDYRFCHSRLITHAEEIAFYNGALKEKQSINYSFQKVAMRNISFS